MSALALVGDKSPTPPTASATPVARALERKRLGRFAVLELLGLNGLVLTVIHLLLKM
jgi:hypothetical protein